MEIISSNSPDEIRENEALRDFSYELRELAANLLRVIAGAGKPEIIIRQICVAKAAAAECTSIPAAAIQTALEVESDDNVFSHCTEEQFRRWTADGSILRHNALRLIVKGAARWIASALLEQRTLQANGESLIYEGHRDINRAVELSRAAWEREVVATAPAPSPRKRKIVL